MAEAVIMPRQGQSVESCIIAKWHKKKGDKVKVGDLLFTYETDKATFDEEAKVEGILLEIFFDEGDDVPVLTNVCVIGEEGESISSFNPSSESESEESSSESPDVGITVQENSPGGEVFQLSEDNTARIKVSPRARILAKQQGIDLGMVVPSGPNERVIERDVLKVIEERPLMTSAAAKTAAVSGVPIDITGTGLGGRITTEDLEADQKESVERIQRPEPSFEEIKLTNIRKVIAKAMHESLSTTAQLTLNSSFDASEILSYRKKVKERGAELGLENITLNDMILFTVSRVLPAHKELNAHFLGDKMRLFNRVNLGVAVDTERGLMVPTLMSADEMSLNEISRVVRTRVDECKKGTINPDLLKGGSFTVTNLGTLGIESFTPVLNPPQTGILGVNTIVQRVREVEGDFIYYPAMGLSLTFDHRALDGAPAAKFLKDLCGALENFALLLTK